MLDSPSSCTDASLLSDEELSYLRPVRSLQLPLRSHDHIQVSTKLSQTVSCE